MNIRCFFIEADTLQVVARIGSRFDPPPKNRLLSANRILSYIFQEREHSRDMVLSCAFLHVCSNEQPTKQPPEVVKRRLNFSQLRVLRVLCRQSTHILVSEIPPCLWHSLISCFVLRLLHNADDEAPLSHSPNVDKLLRNPFYSSFSDAATVCS